MRTIHRKSKQRVGETVCSANVGQGTRRGGPLSANFYGMKKHDICSNTSFANISKVLGRRVELGIGKHVSSVIIGELVMLKKWQSTHVANLNLRRG